MMIKLKKLKPIHYIVLLGVGLSILFFFYKSAAKDELVPFQMLHVDTRGSSPIYQYSPNTYFDRELKGRIVLGLLYHQVPVKLDRYKQILIPKIVFENKEFMINFSTRIQDSTFLAIEIYPHPDSVFVSSKNVKLTDNDVED